MASREGEALSRPEIGDEREVEVDEAVVKAASHRLRHRIWIKIAERGEVSPKEIAEELDAPLEKVAYHVRWLAAAVPANAVPLIELVATDRRSGGIQHIYRCLRRPVLDGALAEQIPQVLREATSGSIIREVINDLLGSVEVGAFDMHPARSLLRMHIWVDEEGLERTAELTMKLLAEYQQVEAESLERLAATGERAIRLATHTNAFPLAEQRD
jgi:hypothetical protein